MKHRQIYLLLVAATFFWGANFNLGKFLMISSSPLAAAAWRFGVASIFMVIYMLLKEGFDWVGTKKNIIPLIAMALIGIFGFNVSFFYGLQTTSSVNGALIMTLNPTLTVILAALVVGERITWRQSFGLALSMMGVVIVVTGGSWDALVNMHFVIGDAFILFGNFCWAVYAVIGKRMVKGMSPIQVTAVTMAIGATSIVVLALMLNTGVTQIPSTLNLFAICVMALFGTVLAYLWWNNGIKTIGPAKTSVFFDLVPIFTMIIAVSLGERLLIAQLIGALFVITGVLFSSGVLAMFLSQTSASNISSR
jgi:drug/metabolite transporter (DMT)-like permease